MRRTSMLLPMRAALVAVAVGALVMVSGCAGIGSSPTSIALEVIRGTPADIVLDDSDLDRGTPLAFWGDDRATLRVVTWGSSSCPPIARSLSPAEPGIVVLDFAPNPAEFCTADFAPTTHVLETPAGVDTDDLALTVVISASDGTAEEFAVPIRD